MTTPVLIDTPLPITAALQRMSRRLTVPFAPGADTLTLDLQPGAGPGSAVVAGYDFTDHFARFETPAHPTYVLRTLIDLAVATPVTIHLQDPGLAGGAADLTVTLAAGTAAGDSVVLTLPSAATATARITALSTPAVTTIPAEQAFSVIALLGNTARLLWVLAAEREHLRRAVQRTAAQRRLETATGSSLDLIGADLAVPRFPPLPHTFDSDTTALYHLDDAPGAPVAAEDFTGRFPGRTAHPGVLSGAVSMGAPGRFGTAAAFTGPGSVTIAADPAFDIAAAADFTAECFAVPDPTATDGTVLGRGAGGAGAAGWNIAVGNFGRGRDRSVRAAVSDGTTEIVLHGDVSLPTDQFTHLALVLDRGAARVALFVAGVQADAADAAAITAIAPAQDLLIGPGATGFRGRVDEVRISGVARRSFAPVLGEGDDHYRRRLALFRRWVLPTPSNLAAALNQAVGPIGGLDDPLVVDDADSPMVRGTHTARVVPVSLTAGTSISADGGRDRTEADLYPDDADTTFDPAFLIRHDAAGVDYGPATGPGGRRSPPHAGRRCRRTRPAAGPARDARRRRPAAGGRRVAGPGTRRGAHRNGRRDRSDRPARARCPGLWPLADADPRQPDPRPARRTGPPRRIRPGDAGRIGHRRGRQQRARRHRHVVRTGHRLGRGVDRDRGRAGHSADRPGLVPADRRRPRAGRPQRDHRHLRGADRRRTWRCRHRGRRAAGWPHGHGHHVDHGAAHQHSRWKCDRAGRRVRRGTRGGRPP